MTARSLPRLEDIPATYVDRADDLVAVCAELAAASHLAVDTEFIGERTYAPVLEVIQLATERRIVLVDCRAVPALEPVLALLAEPRIEKVMHAGQQDLDLFFSLTGRVPSPVVDTQVAAAMAGYGAQLGYAALAERLLNASVDKSETLTDWSRRPLTPAQLAYAADDVRYLLPLYAALRARLEAGGRWAWLVEECRRVEGAARGTVAAPEEAWQRVRGRGALRAKGLVVLRALAAWREELAQSRDRPRASVARDEALIELARKAPTTVEALRGMRAGRSRDIDRCAADLVQRVAAALETPRSEWPPPPPPAPAAPPTGVVELLQAVLRLRAEQANIAPSLLATSAELQELVQAHAAGTADQLPIARGWRRTMAGAQLLAILDGQATVGVDPVTRCLRVEDAEDVAAQAVPALLSLSKDEPVEG